MSKNIKQKVMMLDRDYPVLNVKEKRILILRLFLAKKKRKMGKKNHNLSKNILKGMYRAFIVK